ncbi:MAG: glycosyltransferase family 2 protein [Treponemataceae bacterium]
MITKKENLPKLTVITVTYNLINARRKDFFLQCVESVKNQTYKNIEHLIIDGASTDGTLELIQSTGLAYISESDEGIYDAMNKGIEKATGDYITFLNSDDYWHGKRGVEKSIIALEKNNADFSYGDCIHIEPTGKYKGVFKSELGSFFVRLPASHQTMIFKMSAIKNVGIFNIEYKIASDYDLILRLLLSGSKAIYIDILFTTFRVDGLSSLSYDDNDIEYASILKSYYNKYANTDIDYKRMYHYIIVQKKIIDEILKLPLNNSTKIAMKAVISKTKLACDEYHIKKYSKVLPKVLMGKYFWQSIFFFLKETTKKIIRNLPIIKQLLERYRNLLQKLEGQSQQLVQQNKLVQIQIEKLTELEKKIDVLSCIKTL